MTWFCPIVHPLSNHLTAKRVLARIEVTEGNKLNDVTNGLPASISQKLIVGVQRVHSGEIRIPNT